MHDDWCCLYVHFTQTQNMLETRNDFIQIWLHEDTSHLELQWRFLLILTEDSFSVENVGRLVTPAKKLEDTIRLAELVIEVLQQNEEHHAEVRRPTVQSMPKWCLMPRLDKRKESTIKTIWKYAFGLLVPSSCVVRTLCTAQCVTCFGMFSVVTFVVSRTEDEAWKCGTVNLPECLSSQEIVGAFHWNCTAFCF